MVNILMWIDHYICPAHAASVNDACMVKLVAEYYVPLATKCVQYTCICHVASAEYEAVFGMFKIRQPVFKL